MFHIIGQGIIFNGFGFIEGFCGPVVLNLDIVIRFELHVINLVKFSSVFIASVNSDIFSENYNISSDLKIINT